jgi:hypothetical protein
MREIGDSPFFYRRKEGSLRGDAERKRIRD